MTIIPEEGLKESARRAEFLLRLICAKVREHGRAILSRHHISPPQFEIMVEIYFEGELSQAEMPKKLHLAKSTVSALLDRLEKQGMISRKKTAKDRRISTVKLTFKGSHVIEQVIERRSALIESLLQQLSPKEREQFVSVISRFAFLLENMEGNM